MMNETDHLLTILGEECVKLKRLKKGEVIR